MQFTKKVSQLYKFTAYNFFNFLVLLLLFNAFLYLIFQLNEGVPDIGKHDESEPHRVVKKYGIENLRLVYPGSSDKEINEILTETWSRPYVKEPYTSFKERPYQGKHVNVDPNGFRMVKDQGPWPPGSASYNVLILGGSTAFGYGVSDHETLPSYLQEALSDAWKRDVRVYNFGRGDYNSTLERLLFQQLLVEGFIPDLVIFLDGLNDFKYTGRATDHGKQGDEEPVRKIKSAGNSTGATLGFLHNWPMSRAARAARRWALAGSNSESARTSENGSVPDSRSVDDSQVAMMVNRYLSNMRLSQAIANAYGIKALFVWQPIPMFKYNLDNHLFFREEINQEFLSKRGYEMMEERLREETFGPGFLWCADIQEKLDKPLYVDVVHYSKEMNKVLATALSDSLVNHHLSPERHGHTGPVRKFSCRNPPAETGS